MSCNRLGLRPVSLLLIFCGVVCGFYVSGCSITPPNQQSTTSGTSRNTNPATKDKKVVLTTFTVLADMVRNVAGDKVIVESITKPGSEIHGYEVTPQDLVRGQSADVIFDNGLNLESWAEKFYNSIPQVKRITISEGIKPVEIAEDAYQGKPNPHAWMSPQNAVIYVENIRKALVDLDPANADIYNQNAEAYSQRIQEVDQKLRQAVSSIPAEKRYMVTCEGAFSYVARDYNLQEVYIWAVNSEQQATPKQVEKVIETVRENQIPTVFCESTVSNEAQEEVAKATGAKFGGVFYVDSLSDKNGPAPTYLQLIEYNVNTLIQGLQGN